MPVFLCSLLILGKNFLELVQGISIFLQAFPNDCSNSVEGKFGTIMNNLQLIL